MLRRLAYPNRLCDLQLIFGRRVAVLSEMLNVVVNDIYNKFNALLVSLNQEWLDIPKLYEYAQSIRAKGGPMASCFGFIDGKYVFCI